MQKMILLIALFGVQIAFSQVPDWQWVRNMDLYFDTGRHCSAVDSNGDVIVITDFRMPEITFGNITLYNDSPSYYYADIAIVKYDSQGNVLWAKKYGGPKTDFSNAVATDAFGNFYISGGFNETIKLGSFTLTTFTVGTFIAKFDPNGDVIFAKKITEEGPGWATKIKTDTAGNVYLTGSFSTPTITLGTISATVEDFIDTQSSNRGYVAKMDSQGNYLWLKISQSNHRHFTGVLSYGLDIDTAGNVYNSGQFGCNTLRFGAITLTKTAVGDNNLNMYLVKYDPDGNELWARNAGSNQNTATNSRTVKTDLENNVYAAGSFSNSINFDQTTLTSSGDSQQFIVKYDAGGNVLWAKNANAPAGYNAIYDLDTDENNNLYTAGVFNTTKMDFGNGVLLTNPSAPQGAVAVVRYTPQGEAVWGRKAFSLSWYNMVNIHCKSENELYLSGCYNTSVMNFGDHTITKSEESNNQFLAKLSFDPLTTTSWNTHNIKVYPNPVQHQLYMDHSEVFTTYTLYNVLGIKVASGGIRLETGSINVGFLSKGVYLLQLSNSESKSETIKIIKE